MSVTPAQVTQGAKGALLAPMSAHRIGKEGPRRGVALHEGAYQHALMRDGLEVGV